MPPAAPPPYPRRGASRRGCVIQLRYGNLAFAVDSTGLTQDVKVVWNQGGQAVGVEKTFHVEGYLQGLLGAPSAPLAQAAIDAQMTLLLTGLSVQNQPLVLLRSDGSPSSTILSPAGSLSGVQVHAASFPRYKGAEYVNYRWFTFSAFAAYAAPSAGAMLWDFHESVEWDGGDPFSVARPAINGPGQIQQVYPITPFLCTQSGRAVGYLSYPPPAPMLYPANLLTPRKVGKDSPKRRSTGKYTEFPVSWRYQFGSIDPLPPAQPTLWI